MADERLPDAMAVTEDQREDAIGHARLPRRLPDGLPDERGGAEMRRVGLHHDGAARRQRRGGVAARDGKGERKVAGAEHDDGPERDAPLAQVGTG